MSEGSVVGVATAALSEVWTGTLGEPVTALATLPSGVAAGGSEGRVEVYDGAGGPLIGFDLGDALLTLAAAPDGTRLAAGGTGSRALWSLDGGSLTGGSPVVRADSGWCGALAWAGRSRTLAAADGRTAVVLDRDGTPTWCSEPLASTVSGLSWLRGQDLRLAAAAYLGVSVLEPSTGRRVHQLAAPGAIAGLATAPNGRWVVGGSQDATLHGWALPAENDFRMSGFPTTVAQLAFHRDGRWLACDAAEDLTCWDFSGRGPTGRSALMLSGHRVPVTALAWLPAVHRDLVSGDAAGTVALWRLDSAAAPGGTVRPRAVLPGDDPVTAIATGSGVVYVGRRGGTVQALVPERR